MSNRAGAHVARLRCNPTDAFRECGCSRSNPQCSAWAVEQKCLSVSVVEDRERRLRAITSAQSQTFLRRSQRSSKPLSTGATLLSSTPIQAESC
eukprot:2419015-Rhodomonas_salina.1